MDKNYPILDMAIIFHKSHGSSYFGKDDLSEADYQIELGEGAK